ncbi:MAG: hypothetical protein O7C59_04645 [Rickettsia endosymbiont of Ixodes persulcatus]|nr:hypothetical protein [Rickettsia endosymbiont of Ixodes persulcatus]
MAIVMLGLNSLNNNKSISLLNKIYAIIHIIKNPRKAFAFVVFLVMFSFLSNLLGLHVIYNDTYLLFITLTCRIAFFKLVIGLLSFALTKNSKELISNLSLSFSDILFIFFTSIVCVNYFIPLLKTFTISKAIGSFGHLFEKADFEPHFKESDLVQMAISRSVKNELEMIVYNRKHKFVYVHGISLGEEPLNIFYGRKSGAIPIQISNTRCQGITPNEICHIFQEMPNSKIHFVRNGQALPVGNLSMVNPATNYFPENHTTYVEESNCPQPTCQQKTSYIMSCRFCTLKCCIRCM